MNNTKIQRWGVFLAQHGALIKCLKGTNDIRTDMLSRIKHGQVELIDKGDWIDPNAFTVGNRRDILLLVRNGVNLGTIEWKQRIEFSSLREHG